MRGTVSGWMGRALINLCSNVGSGGSNSKLEGDRVGINRLFGFLKARGVFNGGAGDKNNNPRSKKIGLWRGFEAFSG